MRQSIVLRSNSQVDYTNRSVCARKKEFAVDLCCRSISAPVVVIYSTYWHVARTCWRCGIMYTYAQIPWCTRQLHFFNFVVEVCCVVRGSFNPFGTALSIWGLPAWSYSCFCFPKLSKPLIFVPTISTIFDCPLRLILRMFSIALLLS